MQQRGFTLIELVIVIVILGILAVTAAPRFIDLQGDARASTLQGAKAALTSGMQLVYAKSAIAGEQRTAYAGDATTQITINGNTVDTDFGYPDAEVASITNLNYWVEFSDADWTITVGSPAAGQFTITPEGTAYNATEADACQLIYTEAANANTAPVIVVQDQGC
ncbi:prepilin-type N-terminal cleavage/methylation domain-containing protein [Alteromonas sp. 1_MG-2023]|uniref:type II secretion system protein n=1 Tax=unclassified Alteromonas TaxID=2614992 RepID=UPI0026E47969|nr:prepilin-type N-terminal cleavage/methylation domain-containing protein [Alteromonas sp. 1_MG-2023]MDO6473954.1 prepilin-type N-terminal cleavage/methylation domain-containing protein [Alteromonas sp. 1_MG-2023]